MLSRVLGFLAGSASFNKPASWSALRPPGIRVFTRGTKHGQSRVEIRSTTSEGGDSIYNGVNNGVKLKVHQPSIATSTRATHQPRASTSTHTSPLDFYIYRPLHSSLSYFFLVRCITRYLSTFSRGLERIQDRLLPIFADLLRCTYIFPFLQSQI